MDDFEGVEGGAGIDTLITRFSTLTLHQGDSNPSWLNTWPFLLTLLIVYSIQYPWGSDSLKVKIILFKCI